MVICVWKLQTALDSQQVNMAKFVQELEKAEDGIKTKSDAASKSINVYLQIRNS